MPNDPSCPECGRPLPEGVLAKVCPACSLQGALKLISTDAPEVQPSAAAVAEPSTSTPPALPRFGDYELQELLARGGMGVVYKARQISLNRPVALKRIAAGVLATPAEVKRFHAEAEAIAHLQHPNIVAVHEIGEHEGEHYFSMDYVAGRTLAKVVREGPLPAVRAASYVRTIARAVHYAHQQGVIHRDLKPANVIIDEHDQPRITDFGLAKLLTSDFGLRTPDLTTTGQVLGSPNYLPPEQAELHRGAIGPPSDVYALGAILYHLLTGRPPFQAQSLTTLLRQVIENEPVAPRLLNPNIPRDLETICLKCLQKEPTRRYASAQALADDLECWSRAQPIQARRATQFERVWLWCRRQPVRASLIGALALALVLGLSGVLWQWNRAKAGELRARQNAYAADMNLAERALAAHDVGQAIMLLEKHRPTKDSGADLRGWEWRYLWQLCRPDEFITLHQYSNWVTTVAVSKDGKLLASQEGNRVALWDLPGRRPLFELTNVAWGVLALSPAENVLAVGGWNERDDQTVNLWNADTRQPIATLTHEAPLRCLAFSPDGNRLASFDQDGNIRLTEWSSGQILTRFAVPPIRAASALSFSPDGQRLAIGGDAGMLLVLDCRSLMVEKVKTDTGLGVTALAFSPLGQVLAAGFGSGGDIWFWDVTSLQVCGRLTNHTAGVTALAFSSEGRRLVSAGEDSTLRVWSMPDAVEVRCFQTSQHIIGTVALLGDGKTLVTGDDAGTVCLWDLSAAGKAEVHASLPISYALELKPELGVRGYAIGKLDPNVVRRFGLAYAPDGRSFVTTDRDGFLALYDARSRQVLEPLPALGSNNWAVALSPDGRWLAAGQASGRIGICDWKTRTVTTNVVAAFEWLGRLRFSPSGRFLMASVMFNDQSVQSKIWRTNDWSEVPLQSFIGKDGFFLDLSPDDDLLAAGYTDGAVRLWRFPSGQPVATLRQQKARNNELRFSPDGRLLVAAGADGPVVLWDVRAARRVAVLRGHSLAAWSAAFSPDGRRVATGGTGASDAVKLWDIATQRELLCLSQEGRFFADVSFSPDGNTLQAASFSGVAHLWRVPSWAEIEAVEQEQKAR